MSILTLTVEDIAILKKAQHNLRTRMPLSSQEENIVNNFLTSLPPPETLLNEQFPLYENFEIKLFDIKQMWPQIKKWISLFNNLPKNGDANYPRAYWVDAEEDKEFWKKNTIIKVAFIPSLAYSRNVEQRKKIIGLNLKTDGTAYFEFWQVNDSLDFPELYQFEGSWKEAYLLTVKTLKEGWPQTKFPPEFETLLKK